VRELADRPDDGWIREVRIALGMTSAQLAARMQVSQSAVTQLEQSEVAGTARLDSLHRAAAALDCDLVYALVPKRGLDRTVHDRAVELATHGLTAEESGGDPEVLARRVDHIAGRLIDAGQLWEQREAD
jgi:predicted DNA-binding mobile mystery protein A